MSDLKFTCPACGQSMQCEKAYCGDKIHCPACRADLRVPFSHTPPEPGTQLPRAELLSNAATSRAPAVDQALAGAPVPVGPAKSTALPEEPHYLCPVCHAELRTPTVAPPRPNGSPPFAELVREAEAKNDPNGESPASPASITEREQQIASAREANPVSLYPAMKPRLSYVLNGGQAVPSAESSPGTEEPSKQDPKPGADSFAE